MKNKKKKSITKAEKRNFIKIKIITSLDIVQNYQTRENNIKKYDGVILRNHAICKRKKNTIRNIIHVPTNS